MNMDPAAVAMGLVVMMQVVHRSSSLFAARPAGRLAPSPMGTLALCKIIGYYVQKSKSSLSVSRPRPTAAPRSGARGVIVGADAADCSDPAQEETVK
jgi:hypothetical protein